MISGFTELRVLIVDDEPANVKILERVLSIAGYKHVLGTTHSEDTLDLWGSFRPDLLLLDLMMPQPDGFSLLEDLRSEEAVSQAIHVPILVLTADMTPAIRNRALSLGANDFVTKPFDHDEVLLRIKNLLETRSLQVRLSSANHRLEQKVAERTIALRASLSELEHAHSDLRRSREETVRRLSMAAELRDDDTGHHIVRMSRYAGLLARAAGMSIEESLQIELASQMHDVGKIGIPDNILLKPGKLTPDERSVIERHPQIGFDILKGSSSDLLALAASIALTHHERVDGAGYPRGLKGEGIPLEGRLAAIADVFDALTSPRVYRPAMPIGQSFDLMESGRGSQFDADLLDLFFARFEQMVAVRALIESETPQFARSA